MTKASTSKERAALKARLADAKIRISGPHNDDVARISGLVAAAKNGYVAPSREGKLHLSAWLDPSYKAQMRAIQMNHPEKSLQDLYAEALNDLFKKYGVGPARGLGPNAPPKGKSPSDRNRDHSA